MAHTTVRAVDLGLLGTAATMLMADADLLADAIGRRGF
jgi:hypothetical protein